MAEKTAATKVDRLVVQWAVWSAGLKAVMWAVLMVRPSVAVWAGAKAVLWAGAKAAPWVAAWAVAWAVAWAAAWAAA